ncbi:MAG: DUF6941 family protein [Chloroflexota bacterium]
MQVYSYTNVHCAALLFTRQVKSEPTTLEGVYDQITAPSFPATIPDVTIWARLLYSAEEVGRHDISLTILDMFNGEQIGVTAGHIELPQRPERGHPSNDVTFNISDSRIPHPGEYEFRLGFDGQPVASVWLTVIGAFGLN